MPKLPRLAALPILLAWAAPTPAATELHLMTGANAESWTTLDDDAKEETMPSGLLTDLRTATTSTSNAAANGMVGFQLIRLGADAFATGRGDSPDISQLRQSRAGASAYGYWQDDIIIDSPTLNGTQGVFIAGYHVSASWFCVDAPDTSSRADVFWFAEVYVDGEFDTYIYGNDSSIPDQGGNMGALGTFNTRAITFTFGQPFTIRTALGASASALANFSDSYGEAQIDMNHSLDWGGIVSVKDANGDDVSDFTASSPSTGLNYKDAVPEPASLALVLAAGALLLPRRAGRGPTRLSGWAFAGVNPAARQ